MSGRTARPAERAALTPPDEARLRRFARLVAPRLDAAAALGIGTRAARDRPGAGLEFLDVTAWRPGDDTRHVDWRQTARRAQPMLRRYRDERASDWLLCVDGSASMSSGRKWEMAATLAAAQAFAMLDAGHRVGLAVFADRVRAFVPAGRGGTAYAALLRALRGCTPPAAGGHSRAGLCAERLPRNAGVVVISDFLRPDGMRDAMRRLRAGAASMRAIQVLARDELAVEGSGRLGLVDVESGVRVDVADTSHARALASEALEQHAARLERDCASLGVPFSRCDDAADWERVLLAHWER